MPEPGSLIKRLEALREDPSMPADVSQKIQEIEDGLADSDKDLSIRANTAASRLQEISNNPDISQHTRTEIWNLASKVENLTD